MPELPEVETITRHLTKLLKNKTITDVLIIREKNVLNDKNYFVDTLKNKKIQNVTRYGKFLVFNFYQEIKLIVHLRMDGKFFLRKIDEPFEKHDIAIFYLNDETYLAYNDTRKFGILKLCDSSTYLTESPLKNVGPDPFMVDDYHLLKDGYKNKIIPIKTALLDQSIISGIGNIYADEILFKSKIHPLNKANSLSDENYKDILNNAKIILQKAIDEGGSTIKSYHPDKGVNGNFQVHLNVYGRKDENCRECNYPIKRIFINGRSSCYCPHCQKLNTTKIIGVLGPVASGKTTFCNYINELGYKIFNADKCVHDLYEDKAIIKKLKQLVPSIIIKDNKIDRQELLKTFINSPKDKKIIEEYLYKIVNDRVNEFIISNINQELLFLEIPLLFQAKCDEYCDEIVLLTIDEKIQKERLLKRNGQYESYLRINQSFYEQLDKNKIDYVIDNSSTVNNLNKKIKSLICDIKKHQ